MEDGGDCVVVSAGVVGVGGGEGSFLDPVLDGGAFQIVALGFECAEDGGQWCGGVGCGL